MEALRQRLAYEFTLFSRIISEGFGTKVGSGTACALALASGSARGASAGTSMAGCVHKFSVTPVTASVTEQVQLANFSSVVITD